MNNGRNATDGLAYNHPTRCLASCGGHLGSIGLSDCFGEHRRLRLVWLVSTGFAGGDVWLYLLASAFGVSDF